MAPVHWLLIHFSWFKLALRYRPRGGGAQRTLSTWWLPKSPRQSIDHSYHSSHLVSPFLIPLFPFSSNLELETVRRKPACQEFTRPCHLHHSYNICCLPITKRPVKSLPIYLQPSVYIGVGNGILGGMGVAVAKNRYYFWDTDMFICYCPVVNGGLVKTIIGHDRATQYPMVLFSDHHDHSSLIMRLAWED